MKNVLITNIHENPRFPNIIYGELREEGTNKLCVAATLRHILQSLRDNPDEYHCVNAAPRKP